MTKELTLRSLFDGSGGFPLAGIISGIKPVWASEIEPFPIRVTTKRFPNMKHYGNISTVSGYELEPVDIITFGSPCQDMSIAGKRDGLSGERSGLFYEAIRIIKEMRSRTNGKYPRFIVWENVPGAFSSNKGEDFRCVIEEICKIKEEVSIPKPDKWQSAGCVVGNNYSVSWRVLDAQYWGVPQRRKRIYLVANFAGESAGKILFESEGLSGYSAESFRSWQRIAGDASIGIRATGFDGYNGNVTGDASATLGVNCGVMDAPNAIPLDYHPADGRIKIKKSGAIQTLTGRMGTGGGNVPLILKIRSGCEGGGKGALIQEDKSATLGCNNDQTLFVPTAFGICSKKRNAMKSDNPHSGFYKADTSRTLDGNGGNPSCNQGGMAVVARGRGGSRAYDGRKGTGHSRYPVYTTSKNSCHTEAEENVANTLVSTDYKDPPTVTEEPCCIVRRLTPTECARLQGFPDWWCADLGTENPTDEELAFWQDVFETHRKVMGTSSRQKSRNQIIKWLKNPHSDSAEYKMWGNGIALPNATFVLAGIAYYAEYNKRCVNDKITKIID